MIGPSEAHSGRVLPVMRLVSPVPAFDAPILRLARWMQERYVAPLATVLGAITPPRVAGEAVSYTHLTLPTIYSV